MQADIIQLQLGATHQQPLYDVVSHLVYVMDSTDVVTTVVAGKVLMQDRQVQTIDEQALRQSVAKTSNEIRAALREAKAPASE
jgi:5-methylthioadenosine/S-adenosylhomocysteine deaminase